MIQSTYTLYHRLTTNTEYETRYAVPAVIVALAVASPLNALVAYFLAGFTATEISGALQSAAVIFAIILGFIMPQLSNFLSMQRALSGTLKDALDLYHQRSNEVVVTIQRLEDLGISPGETVRDVVTHDGSNAKHFCRLTSEHI